MTIPIVLLFGICLFFLVGLGYFLEYFSIGLKRISEDILKVLDNGIEKMNKLIKNIEK